MRLRVWLPLLLQKTLFFGCSLIFLHPLALKKIQPLLILGPTMDGCKVVAIEPQRECVRLMNASFLKSGLRAKVYQNILSPFATGASVPIDQCHGTAQYLLRKQKLSNSILPGRKQLTRKPRGVEWVNSVRLDTIVDHVHIWHLDGEGSEIEMLKSVDMHKVDHVVLEVIPSRWRSTGIETSVQDVAQMFEGWSCSSKTLCRRQTIYNWRTHNLCKGTEDVYCTSPRLGL